MRVLISAYACEPGKGSEPEVGLRIVLAAASEHDVWVITRENNLPVLQDFLADHPLRRRIHLVGHEAEGLARRFKKSAGLVTLHWYYDRWQHQLSELARRLDEEIGFDVVHHATFATYWTRAGVAKVSKPLVWGPVGGGVNPPLALLPVVGVKGIVAAALRLVARPALATLTGAKETARRAAVVLVQNPETASRLEAVSSVQVLPNAISTVADVPQTMSSTNGSAIAVSVGRLVGWKGLRLAVEAVRYLEDGELSLLVYGEGPDRDRLVRWTRRNTSGSDIRFMGRVDRDRMMRVIAEADVLVHPALHDESPLAVAEALALGTPVVMLDRGGPPIIAGYWPATSSIAVEPASPRVSAQQISAAMRRVAGRRAAPDSRPARQFSEELLASYDRASSSAPPSP